MHNLNHLYYFYIVARLKNVSAAARVLKTSQPSLSTQIKTLEFNLDKKLFVKKGKFLDLTSDGLKIYEICNRMFDIYEELEDFLNPAKSKNQEIRIGVSRELSRPFITQLVAQTLKKYRIDERPKVKLETFSSDMLLENLKTKKVDFILTNSQLNDIDLILVRNFPLPVVIAADNELATSLKLKNIKEADIVLKKAARYLVMPSDHLKLRQEANSYLLKNKLKYETTFESDILASVIQASCDGLGICLIPRPYILKEIQDHSLRILAANSVLWKHQLNIFARTMKDKDNFLKKLTKELESFV